jgi:hypothetical protein
VHAVLSRTELAEQGLGLQQHLLLPLLLLPCVCEHFHQQGALVLEGHLDDR